MLRNIAVNGDPTEKAWALDSLVQTATLMGKREAIGPIAMKFQSGDGTKRRTVYSAANRTDLPGKLLRGEGDPAAPGDVAANEAYDGAGATYDLLMTEFGRNSIDDSGSRLDSTVHYGRNYQNAFWEGRQMVYGDGDGRIFLRFTAAIDVIAHEFFHGVTQATCNLMYFDQSGAINEHGSDVIGSLVKQRVLGQNASTADWLIGGGLLGPRVKGKALRSMSAPGTAYQNDPVLGSDPQPDHMSRYIRTHEDSGGVHLNSGIPNKAFYLAATGMNDTFKAGKIWYRVWTEVLRPRSNFQHLVNGTVAMAREIHGAGSAEANVVHDAWISVGITPRV